MHRTPPYTDMFPIAGLCQHRNVLNPWQLHYQSCSSFEHFLKSCMTLWVKEPALPQDEDAAPVNRMIWQRGWSAWDASADTGMLMWVHSSSHSLAATAIIPHVCGADVALTGQTGLKVNAGDEATALSVSGAKPMERGPRAGHLPSPSLASVNPHLAAVSALSE